jgi:hypothetical protein
VHASRIPLIIWNADQLVPSVRADLTTHPKECLLTATAVSLRGFMNFPILNSDAPHHIATTRVLTPVLPHGAGQAASPSLFPSSSQIPLTVAASSVVRASRAKKLEENKDAEPAAIWQCPVCNANILDEELSIGCDGPCDQWIHASCAGLTRKQAISKSLKSYIC